MEEIPDYSEFFDPKLTAIYDTVNPIDSYKDFFLDLVGTLAPKTILDVGCGTGLLTVELARKGFDSIGLEPSAALLQQARERLGGETIRWIEGHVDQLGSTKADLILMTGHVAQFFLSDQEWQTTLGLLHRALNPGGHLVFDTRNPAVVPFAEWPTSERHQSLRDPVAGELEWWSSNLKQVGNKIRYEIHYRFKATGEDLISRDELVFRTRSEIIHDLLEAHFVTKTIYGDLDGSAFNDASPEMIFVCERKDASL